MLPFLFSFFFILLFQYLRRPEDYLHRSAASPSVSGGRGGRGPPSQSSRANYNIGKPTPPYDIGPGGDGDSLFLPSLTTSASTPPLPPLPQPPPPQSPYFYQEVFGYYPGYNPAPPTVPPIDIFLNYSHEADTGHFELEPYDHWWLQQPDSLLVPTFATRSSSTTLVKSKATIKHHHHHPSSSALVVDHKSSRLALISLFSPPPHFGSTYCEAHLMCALYIDSGEDTHTILDTTPN